MISMLRPGLLVYLLLVIQGCSVMRATSGPDNKDLSVLERGTHRHMVLAELGPPVTTETEDDGSKLDIFSFKQGTNGAAKAGKAISYGILAIGTLGLSELVTNPIEGTLGKGADIQLKVGYTADDLIDEVVVLKDDRWIPIQDLRVD